MGSELKIALRLAVQDARWDAGIFISLAISSIDVGLPTTTKVSPLDDKTTHPIAHPRVYFWYLN